MKLSAVAFAGFRGAKGLVTIDFAPNFVVIVGRNGTGKSTICDAIEFALTGDLRQGAAHKEKGEGILDYIWWRGTDGGARERFVEITLVDDNGKETRVRRTPNGATPGNLDTILCRTPGALEQPLVELCRTAILRDEEITRLSVDLKEGDRFDAVRSALGTADFAATEKRAQSVLGLLDKERSRVHEAYTTANARVTDLTTRLSQARTELADAEQSAAAEQVVRNFVGETPQGGLSELAAMAEARLASARMRTDALARIHLRLQEWWKKQTAAQSSEREAALAAAKREVEELRATSESEERAAALLAEELATAQTSSPRNASLALLREHGQRLGLLEGACPLCGVAQNQKHFAEHLDALSRTIAASNARFAELNKRAAETTARLATMRADMSRAATRLATMEREGEQRASELRSIIKDARALDVEVTDVGEVQVRLADEIEARRLEASRVEGAIAVIQASRAIEQVAGLERELKMAREELVVAERQLARTGKANSAASGALDAIRRARGEFVNEQLAELEPLLVELYQRLRPHVDWPEVHYRLRGDVRRMLRLEVGDGLNPSFLFSSGQRRAAGLAFLLALHLSRSWCILKTLILDDPVQHIDDYRALHLTEVLAAVRKTGRQVVCTVEDESLAKLLARRLRSDGVSGGCLVRMAYSSQDGVHVESVQPVPPLPRSILIPA